MSSGSPPSNERVAWDAVMIDIVDYVREYPVESPLAYTTARHCLIDTLGCGLAALSFPAEITTTEPRSVAAATASRSADEVDCPPSERLITFARLVDA